CSRQSVVGSSTSGSSTPFVSGHLKPSSINRTLRGSVSRASSESPSRADRTPVDGGTMANPTDLPTSFSAYEEGKHRRYSLLFAINGGAFAVAKLFGERDAASILGHLRLTQLAVGMGVLTAIIVIEIYMFGENMRSMYLLN